MILERLPEVLALGTEEKELLAGELLSQILLEKDKDPALSALLRKRLAEHESNLEAGVRYAGRREAPPFLEPRAALRLPWA